MKIKKGIVLAGGTGSRLYPLTVATNKQLLPIYDKPVIYYPLTTLMLAGIQEVLFICTPRDLLTLEDLFGDGKRFGMKFFYKVQTHPGGLPEAFILGERFIDEQPVAMILGDNFFHAQGLSNLLAKAMDDCEGAHIFTHRVEDPSQYGVVVTTKQGEIASIEEKPKTFRSNLAITGLYYFDGSVSKRARALMPSERNELEIVDLLKSYLAQESLKMSHLGRGTVWFDVGTPRALLDASNYVQVVQDRQGIAIASPEEVAWRMNFIGRDPLDTLLEVLPKGRYKQYLKGLLEE
jgi:glucose-1-phosphate thymidylyltransferase